jgi:hypothetical protein
MKPRGYFLAMLTGASSLALCLGLMVLAHVNESRQLALQARQQQLSRGVLGQEAQQISAQLLQDLAAASTRNPDILDVLTKHGYRVQPPAAAAPSTPAATEPKPEERKDASP